MRKKATDFLHKQKIPDLGAQIRLWRRHQKLKQSDLEFRAGLSHNTVSRIEIGTVSPRLETLERLAEALQISVEELQFRSPETHMGETATNCLTTMVERISRLPKHKQKRLLDSIRPLIDLMEEES